MNISGKINALLRALTDAERDHLDRRYALGRCDALALCLADIYGLKTGLAYAEERDSEGETWIVPFHAFVYLDEQTIWDIRGVRSALEMLGERGFNDRLDSYHKAASEADVREAFTTDDEGLDEMILEARRDIERLGWADLPIGLSRAA